MKTKHDGVTLKIKDGGHELLNATGFVPEFFALVCKLYKKLGFCNDLTIETNNYKIKFDPSNGKYIGTAKSSNLDNVDYWL